MKYANSAYLKKQRKEQLGEIVYFIVGVTLFALTIVSGYIVVWLAS